MRPGQSFCGLLVLPQEDLPAQTQVPEWCAGIPVLVRWAAIAVFRTAADCFVCVCVCICKTYQFGAIQHTMCCCGYQHIAI